MDWQPECVIYKTRDEFGDIQVKDQGLIRNLYFANDKKQSSMFIPEPAVLVLNYTQAMMISLLFQAKPEKVLLVGLGGGSLYHFLNNFFTDCSVDIVEIRRNVIDIAERFFKLPVSNHNLTIYHQDAKEFVADSARRGDVYDLVFIDAFDQWGPSEIVSNFQFIQQCKQLIDVDGVCCFNLWNRREDSYAQVLKQFERNFPSGLLELRLGNVNSNVVLFGFRKSVNNAMVKNVAQAAERNRTKFGIDFSHYHKLLEQQNSSLIKRMKRSLFTP